MTESTTVQADKLTVFQAIDSLTGHDEFAIEKAFAAEYYALSYAKAMRALVFVQLRRTGLTDKEAKAKVMDFTQAQVAESFADDADEGAGDIDAPDGDSPAGKDESPTE